MKTKNYSFIGAARIAAVALCVCAGAFSASCGGDDPADPDPDSVTDRVEVTKVELKNRQVSDEAGKLTYTDRVSVTGKVYTKIGDKTESKDVTKETTLKPEAAWSATAITISALTGEIKKPTVTGSGTGLSFDFGAFKLNDVVKFTNPKYTFTEAGKSAEIPFYGFNNGEASGDPVVANTTANEGGKNYAVTTVTQKFKVKHSDGTLSKDVSLSAVFKVEVTKRTLVSYAEKPGSAHLTWTTVKIGAETFVSPIYNYTITRKYSVGADSDTVLMLNNRGSLGGGILERFIMKKLDFAIESQIFEGEKETPASDYSKNVSQNVREVYMRVKFKESLHDPKPFTYGLFSFKYKEGGLEPVSLTKCYNIKIEEIKSYILGSIIQTFWESDLQKVCHERQVYLRCILSVDGIKASEVSNVSLLIAHPVE